MTKLNNGNFCGFSLNYFTLPCGAPDNNYSLMNAIATYSSPPPTERTAENNFPGDNF